MDDEARYRALCARLRACWTDQGYIFDYPPATEEQLRATEESLGRPLPLLLRLLYSEVANGGNGLVWYDGLNFPFVGAQGGCAIPRWGEQWGQSAVTLGELMSHSGWRPHPLILEALNRHPNCFVYCDQIPDQFVTIHLDSYPAFLDMESGRLFLISDEGSFPLGDNRRMPILSLQSYQPSLETWLEEWLGWQGYSCLRPHVNPITSQTPYRELTPNDLAAPDIANSPDVWRGIYRGLTPILKPESPDDV